MTESNLWFGGYLELGMRNLRVYLESAGSNAAWSRVKVYLGLNPDITSLKKNIGHFRHGTTILQGFLHDAFRGS